MKRVKHSVTHEVSAHVEAKDLAQLLLGEKFDAASRFEVHVATLQGRGKVENFTELMLVQFTREEIEERPERPDGEPEDATLTPAERRL